MSSDLQLPLQLDTQPAAAASSPGAPPAERRATERRLRDLALPEPVSAQGDPQAFLRSDRRVRQRRGRRGLLGRAWPLKAIAVVGLTLLGSWAGYSRVMASDRLRVSNLQVRGGNYLSEPEVRELLGPAVGENILSIDIEALKQRLRQSPWVADVTIVRTLPDTLRVDIQERQPLALAEVDRLYLMDEEGSLIDLFGPGTSAFDLPLVRGLQGLDLDERRARTVLAGALLHDLGDLAAEVSEVIPDERGDVRVVLRATGEVLLMGAPYRERLVSFLALRDKVSRRVPDAEYFDIRFPGRIYAKPRVAVATPGSPAATAAAAAPQSPEATAAAPGSPDAAAATH